MSHIGKNPIIIPNNVQIEINKNYIIVIGKLGILIEKIPNELQINNINNKLYISIINSEKISISLWGTFRTIINNMIIGVTKGFIIKLKIIGIGYKAFIENNILKLKIGFSHLIKINIPGEIFAKCIKNTNIYLYGINIQQVHLFAAKIRSFKKPDSYKGKGIQYNNEIIVFKQGKKK